MASPGSSGFIMRSMPTQRVRNVALNSTGTITAIASAMPMVHHENRLSSMVTFSSIAMSTIIQVPGSVSRTAKTSRKLDSVNRMAITMSMAGSARA